MDTNNNTLTGDGHMTVKAKGRRMVLVNRLPAPPSSGSPVGPPGRDWPRFWDEIHAELNAAGARLRAVAS